MMLMRELLAQTDHIGCISRLQARADIALGAVVALERRLPGFARPIGLTTRADWLPTAAQAQFLAIVHRVGAEVAADQRGDQTRLWLRRARRWRRAAPVARVAEAMKCAPRACR